MGDNRKKAGVLVHNETGPMSKSWTWAPLHDVRKSCRETGKPAWCGLA